MGVTSEKMTETGVFMRDTTPQGLAESALAVQSSPPAAITSDLAKRAKTLPSIAKVLGGLAAAIMTPAALETLIAPDFVPMMHLSPDLASSFVAVLLAGVGMNWMGGQGGGR